MAPIADPRVLHPPDLGDLGGQDLPLLANRHHWLAGCGVVIYQGESQAQIFGGRFGILAACGLTPRGEFKAVDVLWVSTGFFVGVFDMAVFSKRVGFSGPRSHA
jgi:hypothetical protein